jgi:hypothetical protein
MDHHSATLRGPCRNGIMDCLVFCIGKDCDDLKT